MNKKIRLQVYDKFNGHCAYCGKRLEYRDMQVDHFVSQRICDYAGDENKNHIYNLMPSCRRCNHYKRARDIERFRELIKKLNQKISDTYICKVAIDYGLVSFVEWDGLFYFERENEAVKI